MNVWRLMATVVFLIAGIPVASACDQVSHAVPASGESAVTYRMPTVMAPDAQPVPYVSDHRCGCPVGGETTVAPAPESAELRSATEIADSRHWTSAEFGTAADLGRLRFLAEAQPPGILPLYLLTARLRQ